MKSNEVLRGFMKKSELDAEIVADFIGVTVGSVHRWMRGDTPSRLALLRLADMADCSPNCDLYAGRFLKLAHKRWAEPRGILMSYMSEALELATRAAVR